jgi:hypothetical protein
LDDLEVTKYGAFWRELTWWAQSEWWMCYARSTSNAAGFTSMAFSLTLSRSDIAAFDFLASGRINTPRVSGAAAGLFSGVKPLSIALWVRGANHNAKLSLSSVEFTQSVQAFSALYFTIVTWSEFTTFNLITSQWMDASSVTRRSVELDNVE